MNTLEEYKDLTWSQVMERIEAMAEKVTGFDLQCKRLPKSLREWEAYNDLSLNISNFLNILPLLQDLSKDSIQNRHWVEVMTVTGSNFVVDANELTVSVGRSGEGRSEEGRGRGRDPPASSNL